VNVKSSHERPLIILEIVHITVGDNSVQGIIFVSVEKWMRRKGTDILQRSDYTMKTQGELFENMKSAVFK